MLNYIWLGLILIAVVIAGLNDKLKELTDGTFESAKSAVTIAIGLIGLMAFWLGIMKLAEKSGLIQLIARGIRPVMRRLFPDVPPEHPAMGSMMMNIAANMLGIGNAATPLGLRAMKDLEKLNPHPGTATNAMCTFLAINTSSVQLIPASAIAILASAGSASPASIIGTAFLATVCSTIAGISSVKFLEKLRIFRAPVPVERVSETLKAVEAMLEDTSPPKAVATGGKILLLGFALFFGYLFFTQFNSALGRIPEPGFIDGLKVFSETFSIFAIPLFLTFIPLYAILRGIKVYEDFVEGAKEGFDVAIRVIPFLVAILVAVGMVRASGGFELLKENLSGTFATFAFPPDLLPMVLMRPLSGSGTMALFTELVQTHGPDSLIARTAATIFGSTETTFYVVAVYFGSVAIRRTRHAIAAGLFADLVGVIASVIICRIAFA